MVIERTSVHPTLADRAGNAVTQPEDDDNNNKPSDTKLGGEGGSAATGAIVPSLQAEGASPASGASSARASSEAAGKTIRRADAPAEGWEAVPLYVQITSEFRRMLDGEAKRNFALAIRLSFELDTSGRATPKPSSANDIQNEFGFSPTAQKKYRMSFGKDVAFKELLEPINAPVNQGLYKKMTRDSYPGRFSRVPFVLYEKQMILTVAEWLHFVPYEFQCPLPAAIDAYLRS